MPQTNRRAKARYEEWRKRRAWKPEGEARRVRREGVSNLREVNRAHLETGERELGSAGRDVQGGRGEWGERAESRGEDQGRIRGIGHAIGGLGMTGASFERRES